jgi:MFS family permease
MATASVHQQATAATLLRNRNFAIYLLTASVSNAGSFMQALAVPFVLYDLTGSNTWVGVGAFSSMVPALLVSPWSGTLCDRFDRRTVLLWSNVMQFAAALALWILAVADAMTPWRIVGVVVLGGTAAGFQYAAAQSMPAVLLPRTHLLQGVRLNSVSFTASRAIGPALAGIVLDVWGRQVTFGLNTLSFLVFIAGLLIIRTRPLAHPRSTERWFRQFRSGVSYVRHRPALRLVVISAFVTGFFGQSMVQLAAGLARSDYGVRGGGLGLLSAVYGVGAVLAALILVIGGERLRRGRMTAIGFGLFAVGITVSVSTTTFAVGIGGFLLAGLAHSMTGTSLNTSMQAHVDEEYRGRALSLFLMALLAGMPLGALAGGLIGDQIGLRVTLLGYAVVLASYVTFGMVRLRRFAVLDDEHRVVQVSRPLEDRPGAEPATAAHGDEGS